MKIRSFSALCGAALLVSSLASAAAAAAEKKSGKEDAVFHLQEVSVFDGGVGEALFRGAYAQVATEPFKEVKAYPKLKSKQPLYGKLQFDRSLANPEGIAIYFVLDESGETPPAAKPAEKKPEKRHAADRKLSSYDRLYIDANRDGDLTNDPLLKPMKDPPWKFFPGYDFKERMAFELAKIAVDCGPGIGVRPFPVFPWFMVSGDEKRPTAS